MHAFGHAVLAAAAGVLVRTLAGSADLVGGRSSTVLRWFGHGDALFGLAIAGFLAASAKMFGRVFAGWAEARVAGEVGAALRLEVLDGIFTVTSLRAPGHAGHGDRRAQSSSLSPSASVSSRISPETTKLAALTVRVSDIERGVAEGLFVEARAFLTLVPLVALLACLAPRLAATSALALGAFAVLVMYGRRALRRNYVRAEIENDALLGAADEAVTHADLWATYGAEGVIRAHVAALGRTLVSTSAQLRARAAMLSGTSEVLGALALVVTVGFLSSGAIGGVDRASIVPFAIAFFMTYKPLREGVEGRLERARGEAALARAPLGSVDRAMRAFAGDDAWQPGATGSARREWPLAPLMVRGLVSQGGQHSPLDMHVLPGQIVAIVGPTGVGKTSLLRALLGLDALRAGTVVWGDEDLTQQGVGPSARPFAWVPQDAPVLGETLEVNVALNAAGTLSAQNHSEIVASLLEDLGARGLAASIGDAVLVTHRAVSGGERQWIAVARALATRLPVLLLDEPTSALDPAAQVRLLRALEGLRGKRTVVIVTHRTEPLAIADVVIRLEVAPETLTRKNTQDRPSRDTQGSREEEFSVEHIGTLVTEPEGHVCRDLVDSV